MTIFITQSLFHCIVLSSTCIHQIRVSNWLSFFVWKKKCIRSFTRFFFPSFIRSSRFSSCKICGARYLHEYCGKSESFQNHDLKIQLNTKKKIQPQSKHGILHCGSYDWPINQPPSSRKMAAYDSSIDKNVSESQIISLLTLKVVKIGVIMSCYKSWTKEGPIRTHHSLISQCLITLDT